MANVSQIEIASGIYDVKDSEVRKALNNYVTKNDKYIFVSDSYGELRDETSWILELVKCLNISTSNYYQIYQGGFGFKPSYSGGANNTFLNLIKQLENTISNKNEITKILVGGGFNDRSTSKTDILNAINEFVTYCKNTYPNAKVYIAGLGWSFNSEFVEELIFGNYISSYSECAAYGATYISGSEFIMHNFNFFKKEDKGAFNLYLGFKYVHPNALGSKAIGCYLANSLTNGITILSDRQRVIIEKSTNISRPIIGDLIYQQQYNNNIIFELTQILITEFRIDTYSYLTKALEIGTLTNGFISGGISKGFGFLCTGFVTGGDFTSNNDCSIYVYIMGNRLFAYPLIDNKRITNLAIYPFTVIVPTNQ